MAPSTAWTRELYAPPKSFHSERVRGGVVIEFSTGEAALYSGELLLRVLSGADFCKAWNRWTRPFPPKVARRETWRPSSCVELEEEITRQAPARSYECFRYEWTVHASSITVDHIGEIAQLWLRDTGIRCSRATSRTGVRRSDIWGDERSFCSQANAGSYFASLFLRRWLEKHSQNRGRRGKDARPRVTVSSSDFVS